MSHFVLALEMEAYQDDTSELELLVDNRIRTKDRVLFIAQCLYKYYEIPSHLRKGTWSKAKESLNGRVRRLRKTLPDQVSTSREKTSTQLTSTSVQGYGSSRTQSSSWTPSTSSTMMSTTTTMLEKTGLLRTGIAARSEKVETCDRLHTAAMRTLTVDRTQKTTERLRTAHVPEPYHSKVVVSYGDVITNPLATIKFSQKENTRRLTMTNITNRTIMWALKASTVHSFNAIPAHGILHPGMQQRIIICLVEQMPLKESNFPSKIAIDYAFVNEKERSFDRNVFKSTTRKRHVLQAVLSA
ncbi:hypothetical protein Aduo_016682 [Ancylostoma duodenale]